MAIRHVSGSTGSNANSGTSKELAWRTVQYALTQITEDSTIYVHRGVYEGGLVTPNYNLNFVGVGEPTIDCCGTPSFITHSTAAIKSFRFWNVDIWNWGHAQLLGGTRACYAWFKNCIIGRKGSFYQNNLPTNLTRYWNAVSASALVLSNCTMFGIHWFAGSSATAYADNCIFAKMLAGDFGAMMNGMYWQYSASDPYNMAYMSDGFQCFSAVTYPPPFASQDSSTPDLRFDSGATHYAKYLTAGAGGVPIGAMRGLGAFGAQRLRSHAMWVFSAYNQTPTDDMDQSGGLAAWANNEQFFDTDFESVVIDSSNNKIDFNDGTVKVATIASGTYTTGASLATAVQTALNAASSGFTVTYLALAARLQIRTSAGSLSLLWNTGANKANSACAALGYVDTSDDTGDTSYKGDNYLLVGSATATNAPAVWDDNIRAWKVNTTIVPGATDAEVVSPIVDTGLTKSLKYLVSQKYVTGTGSVSLQYRGDAATFGQQDAAGTTDVDWTSATEATEITFSNSFRFSQAKIQLGIGT